MKRLWIGIVLLLLVPAMGIYLSMTFRTALEPLGEKAEAAAVAALQNDWETASALTRQARADWDRFRNFGAAMADHEPLEEMDSIFARLEILCQLGSTEAFAAECAQLRQAAAALADSQAVIWWNLL